MNFSIHKIETDAPDARQAILERLVAYNDSKTGHGDYRSLAILINDETGTVIGGLWGRTAFNWLFTDKRSDHACNMVSIRRKAMTDEQKHDTEEHDALEHDVLEHDMQEQKEKLKEYQQRYHFWTDKKISQLSFQNNIFLIIGISILGFFWNERNGIFIELTTDASAGLAANLGTVFFNIGIILLSYSIATGLFLAVSRLYDLRITSNIVLTRKQALKNDVSIIDEDLSNKNPFETIKSFWIVFRSYDRHALSRDEIYADNDLFQQKFTTLRQLSKDVGRCSWILVKNQSISLLMALFFFIVELSIK